MKKWKQWQILFSWTPKSLQTDYSHEIKTLASWKKSYDKTRQHIKKQRHHFANKGPYSQSYGFPVVMYGCESWAITKAENACFWIVVLGKTLESPLDCKEIKSISKEINSGYSLKGIILRLQYFGHLMRRADSLEKTLMLGKIEGKRIREQQRMRWLYSVNNSMDTNLSKLWGIVEDRGA